LQECTLKSCWYVFAYNLTQIALGFKSTHFFLIQAYAKLLAKKCGVLIGRNRKRCVINNLPHKIYPIWSETTLPFTTAATGSSTTPLMDRKSAVRHQRVQVNLGTHAHTLLTVPSVRTNANSTDVCKRNIHALFCRRNGRLTSLARARKMSRKATIPSVLLRLATDPVSSQQSWGQKSTQSRLLMWRRLVDL